MTTHVYIFGSGDCGQLGLGEDVDVIKKPRLHPYFENRKIIAISAGGLHTLALASNGVVYSWGCNDEKALGHNHPEFQVGPVDGLAGIQVVQVAAGDSISAALTVDGHVYTWGTFRDSKGVLGHDAQGSIIQEHPTLLDSLAGHRIIQISAGANHLMAITEDGQIYSWGCGEQGQLGRRILERHKTNALRPTNVTPRLGRSRINVTKVVCGSYHTLVVGHEGRLYSMGLNNYGQLGTGDFTERLTAELALEPGVGVIDAGAGEHHSLILLNTGQVYACGRADSGQLGISTIPNDQSRAVPTPIPVPGLTGIKAISTGGNHNLAVGHDNALYTWGYGGMHQLGHGPDQDEVHPKRVSSALPGSIIQVSAGGQHSVVLVKDK